MLAGPRFKCRSLHLDIEDPGPYVLIRVSYMNTVYMYLFRETSTTGRYSHVGLPLLVENVSP